MPKSGVRKANQDELNLINQHYSKRELSEDEIYVFDVFACDNNTVTAYFSRLGTDMIEAFHRDVNQRHTDENGLIVGYLFGHNDQMIPSGTLFKSELVTESVPDGENSSKVIQRFKPSVFMLKNLNVGGINTDDYIRAYEAGHTEDVSVGFISAQYTCDICQHDIRDFWNCRHVPGRTYVLNEEEVKNGATPITKQCTYTVHQGFFKDHNLMELSGVYRGAMWGARIEPSGLSISHKGEMATVDKDGNILVSTNIKDFKPNDILRFNYQFDGSIEKIGSIEEDDKNSEKYKKMEDDLKKAISEKDALNLKVEELSGKLLDFTKRLETALAENKNLLSERTEGDAEYAKLKEEVEKLRNENVELKRNLALSESDKVGLEAKVEELNGEVERLGVEIKHRTEDIETYKNNLTNRCRKLSIQINGQSFNEEFFKKEIAKFSIDELNQKISVLEEQLARMFPVGRKTVVSDKVHSGNSTNNTTQQNSDLYKIK